jgi:hypothetical protein
MKTNAVPQAPRVHDRPTSRSFSLCLPLALVALISLALAGSAVAAPAPGQDGKVHACYRVKGKAKGAMRVVPANKKCRRGERKLAWNVAGPSGTAGQTGTSGTPGAGGTSGSAGSTGSSGETALQAKIASLTLKVEGLEGILQGVTNGDLTGTVQKLTGISGLQLTETVNQVPVVKSLCTQANGLPTQVNNSLGSALSGLSLGGTIPPLLKLTVPNLISVTDYTCPS